MRANGVSFFHEASARRSKVSNRTCTIVLRELNAIPLLVVLRDYSHPCGGNTHNCSHFCLPIGSTDHVCACPDDVIFDDAEENIIHGRCESVEAKNVISMHSCKLSM